MPYDIFGPDGPSQAALDYLQTPGFATGLNTEPIVSGQLTGDLGEYGIKSPMANDGVGIALGAEYRRETLDFNVDIAFATGDLAGQGGPTPATEGAFDVMEAFGEIRIPLVQDTPFFHDLSFEGGYRYSDYSTGISTSTYKLALNWAPVEDIRFRGSYNRAVRAPNIVELFTPAGVGLGLNDDPCAGDAGRPEFTQAQCANTGVRPASTATSLVNPATSTTRCSAATRTSSRKPPTPTRSASCSPRPSSAASASRSTTSTSRSRTPSPRWTRTS